MAFPFLAAAALPMYASTAYNIYDAFRGTPNPVSGDYAAALERASKYSQAAGDPNHPWFKNVEASLREKLRREAVEQIQRDIRLRTRARAAGFPSAVFNPERRDEARSSALIRAFQNASEKARIDTHSFLAGAANSATNVANAYAVPNAMINQSQLADREMKRRAISSLGFLSSGILNAFQQQQQPSSLFDFTSGGLTRSSPNTANPTGGMVPFGYA